jgi:hypothetical protein
VTIWDTWAAIPGWDTVKNTAGYTTATPAYQKSIHDILFKYGFDPTPDQMAMTNGQAIEPNPDSIAQKLREGVASANQGSINTAAAAGLEESGAAAGALNANNENYKRGVREAISGEGTDIGNATSDYAKYVSGLFDAAEQAPAPAPDPTPTVNVPSLADQPVGTPSGVGTNYPTPQGPYVRTGPEAGSVKPPKAKVIKPVMGGMGHVT